MPEKISFDKKDIHIDLHIKTKNIVKILSAATLLGASALGYSLRNNILDLFDNNKMPETCTYSTTIKRGETALLAFQRATGGETSNDIINPNNLYTDAQAVWLRNTKQLEVSEYNLSRLDIVKPGDQIIWTIEKTKGEQCPSIDKTRP